MKKMNAELLSTVSQWFVFIGTLLTFLGGIGVWHYGRLIDADRDLDKERQIAAVKDEVIKSHELAMINLVGGGLARVTPRSGIYGAPLMVGFDIHNLSAHPCYDVVVEWIDPKEPGIEPPHKWFTTGTKSFESIFPGQGAHVFTHDMTHLDYKGFNVFLRFRNGDGVTQEWRIQKLNGVLKFACRTRGSDTVNKCTIDEFQIPDDFPGYDPENPVALFN